MFLLVNIRNEMRNIIRKLIKEYNKIYLSQVSLFAKKFTTHSKMDANLIEKGKQVSAYMAIDENINKVFECLTFVKCDLYDANKCL